MPLRARTSMRSGVIRGCSSRTRGKGSCRVRASSAFRSCKSALVLRRHRAQAAGHGTALILERLPLGRNLLIAWKGSIEHLIQLAHLVAKFLMREDIRRIVANPFDHMACELEWIHPGRRHLACCRSPRIIARARLDDARPRSPRKQARHPDTVRRE